MSEAAAAAAAAVGGDDARPWIWQSRPIPVRDITQENTGWCSYRALVKIK